MRENAGQAGDAQVHSCSAMNAREANPSPAETWSCQECGYRLDGLRQSPGGMVRCPECGRKAIFGATPPRRPARVGAWLALAAAAGLLALLPVAIDRAVLAATGGLPGRVSVLLLFSPVFVVGALLIIAAFAAFAVGPPGSPPSRRWLMALTTILTGLFVGAMCWFAALLYFVIHSNV